MNFETWKANPLSRSDEGLSSKFGASPFPSLEVFIEAIASVGGIQGKIRSWYHFADYGVVVYNISGNRFCENIMRPHKSNNVMYIVDFRTAGFYQKCHDPDCREYRSPLRPIPRNTIPPEFPLSTAGALELNGTEEIQDPIVCDEEQEDEAWWREVESSLANLECTSQNSISSNQSQVPSSLEDTRSNNEEPLTNNVESTWEEDDEWWDAVEREALQIEMSTGIRKLPAWSP